MKRRPTSSISLQSFLRSAGLVSALVLAGGCHEDDLECLPGQPCPADAADTSSGVGFDVKAPDTSGVPYVPNEVVQVEGPDAGPDTTVEPETESWCVDGDKDGIGDLTNCQEVPVGDPAPVGYAKAGEASDCNDDDASAFPGAAEKEGASACMSDADGDGYGDASPSGAGVVAGTDCDDDAADAFPGAAELDDAGACMADTDGDGYGDASPSGAGVAAGADCDDGAVDAFPGAAELEDIAACMLDADEDGWGDSNTTGGVTPGSDCKDDDDSVLTCEVWCADVDGDGSGAPGACTRVAPGETPPLGSVQNSGDCNDDLDTLFTGAAEAEPAICGIDLDGDGYADSDVAETVPGAQNGTDCDDGSAATYPGVAQLDGASVCSTDADDDGYGDANPSNTAVTAGTDCDDTSGSTFPGAAEVDGASVCSQDADGDGHGDATPSGAGVTAGTDCNDDDAFTFVGAAELQSVTECMTDGDGDGWGGLVPEVGAVAGTDCDDFSATTFPGAAQIENPDACAEDGDDDGYANASPTAGVTAGTDCRDADVGITTCERYCADTDEDGRGDFASCQFVPPGELPPLGSVTNSDDCADGNVDVFLGAAANEPHLCTADTDDDGFGDSAINATVPSAENGTDCDDTAEGTFPGAAELDDALACAADGDGDGFGDAAPTTPGVSAGSDCNDESAKTFPGSAELQSTTACMTDLDGDGWGGFVPVPGADVGLDCDDTSVTTFPGASQIELPDACTQDDDDDGYANATPTAGVTSGSDCRDEDAGITSCDRWCTDSDEDGRGDAGSCVYLPPGDPEPAGRVKNADDCADGNDFVYRGAAAEEPTLCTADADNDGWGDATIASTVEGAENGSDCDDDSLSAFPGAAETDSTTECLLDADGDGWGDDSPPSGVTAGRDCDDESATRIICVDVAPSCADTPLGSGVQLDALVRGGTGSYTWSWSNGETLDDATRQDPTATPTAITTYVATVTDTMGHTGTDQVTVHLTDRNWVLGGAEAECSAIGFLGSAAPHSFANDNTTTCTTGNSDPTAYVCPTIHENAQILGSIVVNPPADDDDFIGFVWGWQDSDHYYLLHWKQSPQNIGGCNSLAGMTVKRVNRVQAYTSGDFTCNTDTVNTTVLATPAQTTTVGWAHGVTYDVEILYGPTETHISIVNAGNDSVIADFVVTDSTYPSGKFGTFDYSQIRACNGPWVSSCL